MTDYRHTEAQDILLDRYKELCVDARYYDNKMWTLPVAAFSIMFVALKFIFELGPPEGEADLIGPKILLSVLNTLIFGGFLFLFAKYHLHQLITQEDITVLRDNLFDESSLVDETDKPIKLHARYTIQPGVPDYAPRVTKWFAPFSSTRFMLNIMVVALLCNFGIAGWFIYLGILRLLENTT